MATTQAPKVPTTATSPTNQAETLGPSGDNTSPGIAVESTPVEEPPVEPTPTEDPQVIRVISKSYSTGAALVDYSFDGPKGSGSFRDVFPFTEEPSDESIAEAVAKAWNFGSWKLSE